MSQDPNVFSQLPGGQPLPAPGAAEHVDPYEQARRAAAVDRVRLPAIFLLVTGGMNLIGILYWLVTAINITVTPPEAMKKQEAEVAGMISRILKVPAPQGDQAGHQRTMQITFAYGLLLGSIVATILTVLGGARMLVLRNYPICIMGALAAALPCLSCPNACCGLGEGIGIWALVVLMNEETRLMFR